MRAVPGITQDEYYDALTFGEVWDKYHKRVPKFYTLLCLQKPLVHLLSVLSADILSHSFYNVSSKSVWPTGQYFVSFSQMRTACPHECNVGVNEISDVVSCRSEWIQGLQEQAIDIHHEQRARGTVPSYGQALALGTLMEQMHLEVCANFTRLLLCCHRVRIPIHHSSSQDCLDHSGKAPIDEQRRTAKDCCARSSTPHLWSRQMDILI